MTVEKRPTLYTLDMSDDEVIMGAIYEDTSVETVSVWRHIADGVQEGWDVFEEHIFTSREREDYSTLVAHGVDGRTATAYMVSLVTDQLKRFTVLEGEPLAILLARKLRPRKKGKTDE